MFEMKQYFDGISSLGSLLSTIKSVIDLLPKQEKEIASKKIVEIEDKLNLIEIQIATQLGYEFCKCTFPPQIMLYKGEHEYGEKFQCPACGRVFSPDDMPPLTKAPLI